MHELLLPPPLLQPPSCQQGCSCRAAAPPALAAGPAEASFRPLRPCARPLAGGPLCPGINDVVRSIVQKVGAGPRRATWLNNHASSCHWPSTCMHACGSQPTSLPPSGLRTDHRLRGARGKRPGRSCCAVACQVLRTRRRLSASSPPPFAALRPAHSSSTTGCPRPTSWASAGASRASATRRWVHLPMLVLPDLQETGAAYLQAGPRRDAPHAGRRGPQGVLRR